MLTPLKKLMIQTIFIAFSVFHASRSEKPNITQRPVSHNVYVNQSATFICRAQSSIPSEIEWEKGDGQLLHNIPGSLLITNESLTFLHVRRSDAGIYKCVVKNSHGTSSAQATLTVVDPPVEPTITKISANQTIVEGERVTFTCQATGNPLPQITWKVFLESGDDSASQLERPSPQSIRISSANPKDAGQYLCIAENYSGNDTEAVYLNVVGYPVFIVHPPSNMEVHENTTVTLNCKVIGSLIPEVFWYYDGEPADKISNVVILDNNTLQISNVKFSNSGRYTCMANNSAGLQRSRNTQLQVFRRPKLDCCPGRLTTWQNHSGIEGKSISLDCAAAGYPKPNYRWTFENKTISSSSVFIISNVSRTNEGVFSCTVNNTQGEVKLIIYLTVLVPPKISIQPEQAIVAEGESVAFSCTATGIPLPSVSWYSSRGLLLRNNNTLVIANVSRNDQEDFLCEAKNDAGEKTVRANLVVAVQPTFLILPRNISANESSTVDIQCAARGPDEPIISWYRLMTNGEKMKLNHSGNVFTIINVVRNDSGFYICQATNDAGYINTTFFVNVQYPPYALISEEKVNVVAGEEGILHCPINANPAAEILWLAPVSFQGPRLIITKVDISHAGQYSCRGENILGAADAVVQVYVMSSPHIVDLKLEKHENDYVSITCVTIGTPKPDVNWIDRTSPPVPSSVLDGKLLIDKQHINGMKFVCNASNVYGWMTKYVAVPSSPNNFTITKVSSNSVRFSWLTDESKIINNFTVERRSASEFDWVTISSTIVSPWFEDENLPPFTTFIYRVSATNVLGTSEHSESFDISTKEGVPSPPSQLEARSISLTSITVYWKPPREPRGQLNSIVYEIYYTESTGLFKNVTVNSTQDHSKLQKLMSDTLYLIKIRAGRQVDGTLRWSNYRRISARTHQTAPKNPPKEIQAVSNGPRRIYVTWEIPHTYVEGYKLQYKEYESTNHSTVVIKSWNASSYMITGLRASQYYEIQLNMFTTGGDGPWSRPIVVHTETDRFGLPGPVTSTSDSLPWKIAVGGSVLAIVLLLLLLVYIYLTRKSNNEEISDTKRKKKKSRNQGGYDFTDNMSTVSNESEGSTKGVYNVNIENDHIDLSMFDNSHHSNVMPENMYVENPILPTTHDDSDDSHEAVRLATFIARPSPHPTRHLTGQLSASHVNPAYYPDEDNDKYLKIDRVTSKNEQPNEDMYSDIPVYSQVDFAKQERDRQSRDLDNNAPEQLSDDILI